MSQGTRWVFLEEGGIPPLFQEAIGGHPLVAQTVYQRGFQTIESARAFLDHELYHPASPDELPDMGIACELLARVIRDQGQILVWGDFDVDGQTATTVLVEGLRAMGAKVRYHIPVRARESHGIRKMVLKSHIAKGFDLLLTCDTGVTEHESLQLARNLELPIIVTDHHLLGERLPPANAVVNPQRLAEDHPLRTLPGVGVAYKLIEGLFAYLGQQDDLGHLLELVALGIVADVAEQRGDTRYLLQKGLLQLQKSERIGLNLIFNNANLNPANLNEGHIGFQIAPRLNAVGRLGDANPMVEFFTTADTSRARELATAIEGLNNQRRLYTRQVEQGAEAQLLASSEDRHAPAIVLHHPSWPGGVVGIVASRLAERYHKPVILLTGDDPIHGSARSIPGLHITAAIAAQSDLLTGYGGHPMAAGLSMSAENYPAFKRRFHKTVEAQLPGEIVKTIEIAQEVSIDQLDLELVREISRLAPFGSGNPPLHFLLRELGVLSVSQVGVEREHRQVTVVDPDDNQLRLIWWNGADEPLPEAQFDLVCKLTESDYKGTPQLSAEWVDFHLSEAGQIEIQSRQVEIVDCRAVDHPQAYFTAFLQEFPQALLWGEGALPKDIAFNGRHQLGRASHLVIWTIPPSQSVLRQVIDHTKPQTVAVFGFDPNLDDLPSFMNRLGGAVKHVITSLDGEVGIERLAAACAAEEATIQAGLLLWQAKGKLMVELEPDKIRISADVQKPDLQAIGTYESLLLNLLGESRAYRSFFSKCDLRSILSH